MEGLIAALKEALRIKSDGEELTVTEKTEPEAEEEKAE